VTFSSFLFGRWNKGTAETNNTVVPIFVFILFIKRQTAKYVMIFKGNNSNKKYIEQKEDTILIAF